MARRHSLLGLSCLLVNTVLIRLTAKFLFPHSFNVNKKRDCSVRMYNPPTEQSLVILVMISVLSEHCSSV